MKNWVQTQSGVAFDLERPTAAMVRWRDIQRALEATPRFNGHAPESVWSHSCRVATLADAECPGAYMYGLLHDAHEAYTGDIVSPVKRLLGPEIHTLEARVQAVILEAAGLPEPPPEIVAAVRWADAEALRIERRKHFPDPPRSWGEWDIEPVCDDPDTESESLVDAVHDARSAYQFISMHGAEILRLVAEFNESFDVQRDDTLREALILEEMREQLETATFEEGAKEACDVLYVCAGYFVERGIAPVWVPPSNLRRNMPEAPLCPVSVAAYMAEAAGYLVDSCDSAAMLAFREVHRSNMSKIGPGGEIQRNDSGKVVKGPWYSPAQVDSFVGMR